jgi:hypothetical protein
MAELKIGLSRLAALGFSLAMMTSACEQGGPQRQSGVGFADFTRAVEAAYKRLVFSTIRKKDGFYNECSVDLAIEHGIRVSETVCDNSNNSLDITIRVTDPASRPPSQRRKDVSFKLGKNGLVNLPRDSTKQMESGVALYLDRTGQSVVLTANRADNRR